jgi:CheY-like chemotaxis protein
MKTVENPVSKTQAVMIVDDYPELLQTVTRMLRRSGYSKLFQATNGEDCVQLAQDNAIDVIFLDISMPGMSGMDACRLLRSTATNKCARIIACTAHANAKHRETFFEAGFNDVLLKPFGYPELMNKLTELPNN